MTKKWTVKTVLEWTMDYFEQNQMSTPRLDSELLLCFVLGLRRLDLYMNFDRPMHEDELKQYKKAINLRKNGECVAYITGEKEFWSLSFKVTKDVLVPRPDTETLIQGILELNLKEGSILDLCTGSGCIGITLAKELKNIELTATDISPKALEIARQNAALHKVQNRIQFLLGDLFEPLEPGSIFDVIVSNPPYVQSNQLKKLSIEVKNEPMLALDGGEDGLDVIRRILKEASTFLKPNGYLFLELADDQADCIANKVGVELFNSKGLIIKDLSNKNRVVVFKKKMAII